MGASSSVSAVNEIRVDCLIALLEQDPAMVNILKVWDLAYFFFNLSAPCFTPLRLP